ncbi:hypothetical protein HMPREF3201_01604 [Megasphaera sp. MJR8396C]|nr:hypothetical protein HMPREF3201_01604 [Megasphaera sp. MJR8396C]
MGMGFLGRKHPVFQSPYGELGNTTWLRKTEKKIYAVSVPLRGIG